MKDFRNRAALARALIEKKLVKSVSNPDTVRRLLVQMEHEGKIPSMRELRLKKQREKLLSMFKSSKSSKKKT